MRRLHPLHTPEFVDRMVKNTGCYFDSDRATGRSTILALGYIQAAMQRPYATIQVQDHHATAPADRELFYTIRGMVDRLGLKHFVFTQHNNSMRFGE